MFLLNNSLRARILSRLDKKMAFVGLNQMALGDDCSCKGGCGTYTPPCSCCAYNS